jgi:hypothetical protein
MVRVVVLSRRATDCAIAIETRQTRLDLSEPRRSRPMERLNSIDIDTRWSMRSFELWHGDVTNLDFVVDLLMISVVGPDFFPLSGTVIGTLSNRLGISIERLSAEPELDFIQPSGRLWVSKVVDPNRISRIMCVELPHRGINASQIVQPQLAYA